MPILKGKDGKGSYYRWGKEGAKYYFEVHNHASEQSALMKARKQEQAAYANGYKEEEKGKNEEKTKEKPNQKLIKFINARIKGIDLFLKEMDINDSELISAIIEEKNADIFRC